MKGNAYRTVEQPHVRWMSERRGANFKVRSIPCGSDARFPRSRNISRVTVVKTLRTPQSRLSAILTSIKPRYSRLW